MVPTPAMFRLPVTHMRLRLGTVTAKRVLGMHADGLSYFPVRRIEQEHGHAERQTRIRVVQLRGHSGSPALANPSAYLEENSDRR